MENDLTIFQCSGEISIREILDSIDAFYSGSPTLNRVWDFTDADVSGFSTPEVNAIVGSSKSGRAGMVGGKVAIVAQSDVAFGLGRMAQAIGERGSTDESRIFRTMQDASEWLFGAE